MAVKDVKLVLLDSDGVLTDGSIWVGENGELAQKYNVRDGLAIQMLQQNSIKIGVITGRISKSLPKRLEDLKVTLLYQGAKDKVKIYEEILAKEGLTDNEVAYMGDDWPDFQLLKRVGFSSAPCDAIPEVREIVNFVSPFPGGRGAIRSLVEVILKSQGKWHYS